MNSTDPDFRSSLKSLDTEEHIDIYFYRRLGWIWARMAQRLGITPNAITIASIFIGVGAGICFYPDNLWINIGGLLLLILANSFDSADGQLARMTRQYSRLGRILDGVAGDLWFLSIYVCICLRTNLSVAGFAEHPWLIWTLAVAAGASHLIQAAMADYYRQLHLLAIGARSELENADALRRRYSAATGFGRIMLRPYLLYTLCQQRITPSAQTLLTRGPLPPAFRDKSLPLMKIANALTFNWRSITLAITLLCGAPWAYFLAELIVGNILLAYMILRHERSCRTLLNAK